MYTCYSFFGGKAVEVLNRCIHNVDGDGDLTNELQTMVEALAIMQDVVIWYMAHQLRAKVQFNAIGKVKENLKIDQKQILVVMDHKQKILPMKYWEGQVECLGKNGMSVLGFMVVSHDPGDVTDISGFQFEFIDVVIQGYSGQDQPGLVLVCMLLLAEAEDANIDREIEMTVLCLKDPSATQAKFENYRVLGPEERCNVLWYIIDNIHSKAGQPVDTMY